MNKLDGKYIIVEIIPNHSNPQKGYLVQLSALKIDNLKLIDRFDYRVVDDLVTNKDLLNLISYDKEKFNYTENVKTIMKDFKRWCEDIPLLIIDNDYTIAYLKDFDKKSIFEYLDMKYSNDVIDKLIDKYHLQPSNYIVDLLYEALLYEYDISK